MQDARDFSSREEIVSFATWEEAVSFVLVSGGMADGCEIMDGGGLVVYSISMETGLPQADYVTTLSSVEEANAYLAGE